MNKNFYDVNDVSELLNCSKSKAYRVIKKVNEAFKQAGGFPQAGKVPVKFFNKLFDNPQISG